MNKRVLLLSGFLALNLMASACGKPAPTGTATPGAGTPKPGAAAKTPAPKTNNKTKPGEKPPAPATPPKAIPEGKKVPVPADWVTISDSARGYEFQVPDGTSDEWVTAEGNIDVYSAKLPKPANIEVFVIAYDDPDTDKDVIIAKAKKLLESLGDKDVKFSDTKEALNEDYYLVEFSSVDKDLGPTKGKLLIGLDKNDNYLMFVYSPEPDYKNNEKVIDEIWSSFEMYTGGLSS